MAQPDFMVAKPTEAKPKYSLIGTTLDPTGKDEEWVKAKYDQEVNKMKPNLHDCYEDPFLRMSAYRFEDTMKKYSDAERQYRDRERYAFYFSNPNTQDGLPGKARSSRMLALNYNRSEMNDKYSQYNRVDSADILEMNRVGLKPIQADRMPTGNYNYSKYRPREAKYPFEQYGLIVEKAKNKEEASGMESACQSAERFPNIRENIMRNFTVYDPKKEISRRKYKTLSDALKTNGLPSNIKHKYLLTRNSQEANKGDQGEGQDGSSQESRGGVGESKLVSENDVKELFEKYDQVQLGLIEKHLAEEKRKKALREKELASLSPQEDIGVSLRNTISGEADWQPKTSEAKENFNPEEYERSRHQLPPPDEARRRRDSYTKWVGLNVLDQRHRQEWKEYLEATSKKP